VSQRTNDPEIVVPIVLELFRAYAPARPVRLIGTRVAAFEEQTRAAAPPGAARQLALPV
jgi:hypothetical protein